jgi:hypothetical protein
MGLGHWFQHLIGNVSEIYTVILEVTIARKMLPHPQGIKGSMHNLLNMKIC